VELLLPYTKVSLTYVAADFRDSLINIERGSAQHFTANIQAIVDQLLSPDSPLSSPAPWSPPAVAYFSLYDRVFLSYSMESADTWYMALAALGTTLIIGQGWVKKWKVGLVALVGTPLGMIVGIASANAVAFAMVALDRSLSW
jgi:hypothetical protein